MNRLQGQEYKGGRQEVKPVLLVSVVASNDAAVGMSWLDKEEQSATDMVHSIVLDERSVALVVLAAQQK